MEAEKAKALQLATSYDSMTGNPAFRDLMVWLEDSCDSLELKAAQAQPEDTHHFKAYFTEWQQRKLVVAGIRNRIAAQVQFKNEIEYEEQNERTGIGDPDLNTYGSTNFPGYNF